VWRAVAEAEGESVPLIDATIERGSSSKVVDVEEVDANWLGFRLRLLLCRSI
jgi:hypothetical protein